MDFFPWSRRSVFVNTVKAAVAIAVLSVLATRWLSTGPLDHGALSRLAAQASRIGDEPATTGSVEQRARATRLDPCTDSRRP